MKKIYIKISSPFIIQITVTMLRILRQNTKKFAGTKKKGRYVSLMQKTLLKNDKKQPSNNRCEQRNNIVWNDKFSV